MRERVTAVLQKLPLAAVAACLLLVVPFGESAFHAPKALALATLAAAGLLGLPFCARRRLEPTSLLPLLALAASVARGDAWLPWPVLTQAAFAAALVAWSAVGPRWEQLSPAGAWAGGAAAAVVLLQAAGLDPLAGFAPATHGRLAVYGTLGNPDFAASALSVTGWLALDLARRSRWGLALLAAHLGALVATRSFATLAAVGAGVLVLALGERSWKVLLPGLAAVAVIALGVAGRDGGAALRGRWYLARVAAPHALDAPLTGRGPGAVEVLWPGWEAEHWRARCPDAACVAAHPDAPFTGLQDHVHLDWLERVLEQGLTGLLALLVVLARASARGPALRRAALTTLVVRAFFDFPLARPADLGLLAALLAVR